ncbi:hypothetical protein E3E12_06170 [Formicincola oecophyllae]|uniref:Rod shape-determining protein MreD n=1 Tax=Formicincola oecophyllae TaxID=2558361 RepID=A0A4Y6UA62_9PROT|nr:hypothetical protein [Formicincola oecophyllae]QDH13840.1 hypothetical protein E3E12_06170 [Formicincola oecophyllae]
MRRFLMCLGPLCLVVLFALVLSAPFGLPGQDSLAHVLILGTVWLWALYRPDAMALWSVVLGGLAAELLLGGPPGVLFFWMLVTYAIGSTHVGQPQAGFLASWVTFMLLVAGGAVTEWCLASLHALTIFSFLPVMFQFALGAGIYPLLYAFFMWEQRRPSQRMRS